MFMVFWEKVFSKGSKYLGYTVHPSPESAQEWIDCPGNLKKFVDHSSVRAFAKGPAIEPRTEMRAQLDKEGIFFVRG